MVNLRSRIWQHSSTYVDVTDIMLIASTLKKESECQLWVHMYSYFCIGILGYQLH